MIDPNIKTIMDLMCDRPPNVPLWFSPIPSMLCLPEPMKFKRQWFVRLFDRPWKPFQRYYDVGPDEVVFLLTFRGWIKRKFVHNPPVLITTFTTSWILVDESDSD